MNKKVFMTAGFALLITACGSGGGGDDTFAGIDGRGAPVRVGVVSSGTISGFGSVIVNGVRYDTSNARFDIDDGPGSESDLAVGQVVTIVGSTDDDGTDARADSVTFDDLVEGPVESVDTADSSFVVLGQTVRVNAETVFDDDFSPSSLDGVTVGQVVEVSGFFDSAGDILATYVELEDGLDDFEVTGTVKNLDAANFTFEIGNLVVDYRNAMLEDFPNGAPENDQTVEAEGSIGTSGELIAVRVEYEDDDEFDDGDDVELEGPITRFNSATDFDVNGFPDTTTVSTEFENGTSARLALDVIVEVEGTVDGSGVLVAESVEFEEEGTLELEGLVEATTSTSVTLLGVEAFVTEETDFDDQSDDDLPAFGLEDVVVGDYVEVRGYDDSGTLTLTGLERKDDTGESGVSGPVSAVNDPEFTVIGVTVATDENTEFEDADGNDIDAATFFAMALGKFVEVEGRYSGGTLTANEVEIEDD